MLHLLALNLNFRSKSWHRKITKVGQFWAILGNFGRKNPNYQMDQIPSVDFTFGAKIQIVFR